MCNFNDDYMIKILKANFKDTDFILKRNEYFVEIYHNNKSHINDDNFDKNIFSICSHFLSGKELIKLAVTYDFNNIMRWY